MGPSCSLQPRPSRSDLRKRIIGRFAETSEDTILSESLQIPHRRPVLAFQ